MATVTRNKLVFLLSVSNTIEQGVEQKSGKGTIWNWLKEPVTLQLIVPTKEGYKEATFFAPKNRPFSLLKSLAKFNNKLNLPEDKRLWKERVIGFNFIVEYNENDIYMIDVNGTPDSAGNYPPLLNKLTGEPYFAPKSGISFGDPNAEGNFEHQFKLFTNYFKEAIISARESNEAIDELIELETYKPSFVRT